MYHCMLCISYRINNHNRNRVLLYYLFQENKSFGSEKPFAFILWCMRSCVEHTHYPSFYLSPSLAIFPISPLLYPSFIPPFLPSSSFSFLFPCLFPSLFYSIFHFLFPSLSAALHPSILHIGGFTKTRFYCCR
jgi:hypothetical protein